MLYGLSSIPLDTRRHADRAGLAAAQRQVLVAPADLEAAADRLCLDYADGGAGADVLLHPSARHRALTAHFEHARPRAHAQTVERDGRRGDALELCKRCNRGVGETHKSFTDDDGFKIISAAGEERPPLWRLYSN